MQKKYRKKKSKNCEDNKRKLMLLSKCAVRDGTKLSFIKEQEGEGLLSMNDKSLILEKILIQ